MIDFSVPPELERARRDIAGFMDQHVYANEHAMVEDEGLPVELERDLQAEGEGARTVGAESTPRMGRYGHRLYRPGTG